MYERFKNAVIKNRKPVIASKTDAVGFYGDCGLFGMCGNNDLMSLVMQDTSLSAWLSWHENNEAKIYVRMLRWRGPEGSAAGQGIGSGAISNPCSDPDSWEWGVGSILLQKGLLGREGESIDITDVGERYCDVQPIYTLDGTPISNDLEWQALGAGEVLRDDIQRMLITGNPSNSGEFKGLELLVNTGYTDIDSGNAMPWVDSLVVDWDSNDIMDSVTINGTAWKIRQVVTAMVRRIRQRAKSRGGIAAGDMVLMVNEDMRQTLMDAWACSAICASEDWAATTGGVVGILDTIQARDLKNGWLAGGLFGDGMLPVDGQPISLLVNPWLEGTWDADAGAFVSDLYILTRKVGAREILYGIYHNMNAGSQAFASQAGYQRFTTTDGGRFLIGSSVTNLCIKAKTWIKPGLYCSAPWAQGRLTNIAYNTVLDPVSPVPGSDYYYANPTEAECS